MEAGHARRHERAFARAVCDAADAAARLSHIEGLILTSAPLDRAGGVAGLAAAAQLRVLLLPAAEMAEARLRSAVVARGEAETRLADARARARLLDDAVRRARLLAGRAVDQREADDRPFPARFPVHGRVDA